MSDPKSPRDRVLEVVVFAPAGLAMTLVEEFPRLVDKGRHRIEGQVHTARLVGQFALQMGRRRVEETVSRMGSGDTRPPPPPSDGASAPSPLVLVDDVGAAQGHVPAVPGGPGVASAHGDAATLAIPDYDSLSASQVVQRLDGLSPAELHDVRVHEAGHRRRRTILSRVEQLLAGGDTERQ